MQRLTFKFGIFISFVALSGFILLLPKVAPRFMGLQRKLLLDSFVESTIRNQQINPVEFWKLREFYGQGAYDFRKRGYHGREKAEVMDDFKISSDSAGILPFLKYQSERVKSVEALIDASYVLTATQSAGQYLSDCPLKTESEYVCRDKDNIAIYFVKPISQMKTANAFYDYADMNTKKLIDGKYWFAATKIAVD